MNWLVILLLVVWIYVLLVMRRAEMGIWYYITGSVGTFIFSMILIEPYLVVFMKHAVTAAAGFFGYITKTYDSYFLQDMLFIQHGRDNLSLYVDFECSGVIEMLAFFSLLWFFRVYEKYERMIVSIIGALVIFISNVTRIFIICMVIYFMGSDMYFIAHTIIGRLFFYVCMVLLYFYVFTKSQIVRQKVGAFNYERD